MAQLSPVFNLPFITDVDGNPLSGGKIFTYEGGSNSILKQTYTGPDGLIANTNPIVLNSAGQLGAGISIWLIDGEAYNLVLTAEDGTTVLKQFDNVTGIIPPPAQGEEVASTIWMNTAEPTYLTGTQFLVPGNFVSQFGIGNRARLTLSTGFVYGVVSAVAFASPSTTVTVILDNGATLNGTISKAEYSVLISAGKTVDAGAVSYTNPFPYNIPNTVGYKINETVNNLDTVNNVLTAKIQRNANVTIASGSGLNTPYVINPSPAITSLSENNAFFVRFTNASSGNPSLNVNGLGAVPLMQFPTNSSVPEPAVIITGLISQVIYTAGIFIVLDRIYPQAPQVAVNWQVFTSNDVFTCPSGVTRVKVTAIGGGGGGGAGGTPESPSGPGGRGGVGVAYVGVQPGFTYNVSIGAGGAAGSIFSGGTGGTGGTTTFGGNLVIAGGGTGGGPNTQTGTIGGVSGAEPTYPFWPSLYGPGNAGTSDGDGQYGAATPGSAGALYVEWVG